MVFVALSKNENIVAPKSRTKSMFVCGRNVCASVNEHLRYTWRRLTVYTIELAHTEKKDQMSLKNVSNEKRKVQSRLVNV